MHWFASVKGIKYVKNCLSRLDINEARQAYCIVGIITLTIKIVSCRADLKDKLGEVTKVFKLI